ncbi:SAWADEE HOMEODOMAIN HOMOLOG 1-like protein [Drosera capensis]
MSFLCFIFPYFYRSGFLLVQIPAEIADSATSPVAGATFLRRSPPSAAVSLQLAKTQKTKPETLENGEDSSQGHETHHTKFHRIRVPQLVAMENLRYIGNSKDPLVSSDTNLSNNIAETSIVLKGGKASEFSELAFEARSLRDNAWYDVASFLNFRILVTGDLEVRVRFAGFNNSHDEWVNAKTGVRERSIPLEASDCHRIKVGDLVLCFQERSDYAVYVDAHVIEIQRRLHDIKGCRCIFVVRYDDDKSEDKVPLERICRRP